ncbi:MAG: sulfatase-like hydrolase/transferase [Planctomycetaceae bacterium]|nr:sulfatase-like hydrolase/transferase [Planctomycetaceae bacterium]
MQQLLSGLLTVLLAVNVGNAAVSNKPNVIIIFTDDHGWADLGVQGIQSDIRTPHLDALATGGLRATNGYVTAPQCVPSRAGLLSGRYQPRFGVESNGASLEGFNAQPTIAERLKQAGYATGMSGKWHLGPPEEITQHGFDDVYCNQGGGKGWTNVSLTGERVPPGPTDRKTYHLDANSQAACSFIDRHHAEPFFYYLAYRAPHTPLDAPPKYTSRFPGEMPERRRQALAMISAIDDGVGSIMERLRQHQIEERTLIFFMGDNGAPLKIHKVDSPLNGDAGGWDGSLNAPMNGEKGMLSEGGIRVPWLCYWKGTIPAGQVYEHPVISLDIAATAAALAGLPTDTALDGTNLIPFFTGQNESAPHEALFWRWVAQAAIRQGKWKLLTGGQRTYLFDLQNDPGEQHNVLEQNASTAEQLLKRLDSWSQELSPPGRSIQPMARTWEDYFDFYLDHKPAPARNSPTDSDETIQGWVGRNCRLLLTDNSMQVNPDAATRDSPFIACAGTDIRGPAEVSVVLKSAKRGSAGVAWRTDGEREFAAGAIARTSLEATRQWQTIKFQIPAVKRLIHLRLILPHGITEIREIEIHSTTSKESRGDNRVWKFGSGSH